KVNIGDSQAERLTNTSNWNEHQPTTTKDGRLFFISDKNGIPNIYQMKLSDRTTIPLTNLQTGVEQMTVSADGSRMVVNSINKGRLDIYMIRSPELRKKEHALEDNQWAKRRANETIGERVPAVKYVQQMLHNGPLGTELPSKEATVGQKEEMADQQADREPKKAVTDTLTAPPDSTTQADSLAADTSDEAIDFRNYVFEPSVKEDTTFTAKDMDEAKFALEDNRTEDGRYIPKDYRLKFSTDILYAGGNLSTMYGTYGMVQIRFSDLLGNHRISFGSNLNLDLRNSSYFLQYGYFEHRTNWIFNFFHNSREFQDFSGRLYRMRSFGGSVNMQYPIDRFQRIDIALSMIGLAQDFSIALSDSVRNETSAFAYPEIIYTNDRTVPGLITPKGGSRFALSLTASPPITGKTLQFASVLGDYRKYIDLGARYSIALRGSGAASFGRDSQTFFMGGMQGWINYKYSRSLPLDKLGDTFFTLPAYPLRGHRYNSMYGNKFALANIEFRFPLFAALLPGPIPILPLYNLTGVAFVDAGMAWGQDVEYHYRDIDGSEKKELLNSSGLDFKLSKQTTRKLSTQRGNVEVPINEGDILMGAGFGLRTIVFGLPLRYDIGWPYYRDGFDGSPIHYISIGIDF